MVTAQQGKETDAKESRCSVRLQEAGKDGPALMQCADRIRTKEDTMIKLPKEVARIMKTLTDAKQEAFAVGDCVRDALLGQKPIGWDIATDAGFDKLRELFPEAKVLSETYSILRMEFIEERYDDEGKFAGEDGIIIDVGTYRKRAAGVQADQAGAAPVQFSDQVEDDVARRAFTINAIADNPYQLVDPYNGREDIKKKLIRTTRPAEEIFCEDPIQMMKAIQYAAELGFDLTKEVFAAISQNYRLLEKVSVDKIRDAFTETLTAAHGGKGLGLILDTGILNIILGDAVVAHLTRREKSDLMVLAENIDKTYQVPERRLGLFYTCVSRKKATPSIDKLNFDAETYQHLTDAVRDMARLYFTAQPEELKKFIYERGWDRYQYLANLEKAQRIVFEYHSDTKIQSKMYMIDEFKRKGEAVFVEDLDIGANDLIEAGICTTDDAGKMLALLVETVHVKPNLNNYKELLKLAKKYKRSKFAAMTRGVKWLR